MMFRGMWWLMVLAVVVGPVTIASADDEAPQTRPRVELSIRSWMFTAGETKWSQNASGLDPRLGNPTSTLTYNDNNTQIIELAARVNFARRWYVQGDIGFSIALDRGRLVDDDFSSVGGQHVFSESNSDITGSGTYYVNLNGGYRVMEFTAHRGHLDVIGGFQYWRTKYEATGVQQVICTPSGIPGVACTPGLNIVGVLAITNTTHWITPLSIGVDTEYRLFQPLSITFRGGLSPLSIVYDEDVHHLRSDLQQNPSFSMWGVGVGANAEAGLKVELSRHFALTGGYRVWWNRTYSGTWENHPVGFPSDSVPLSELQTFRYGATVGLTARF